MSKDELYMSIRPLILHTIRSFKRRYGGEFKELLSEANEAYVDALQDYKEELSKFSSWVRTKVWFYLKKNYMRKYKPKYKLPESLGCMDHLVTKHKPNKVNSLLKEASTDVITIINLILDPYDDIVELANQKGGVHKPNNLRSALFEFLAEMGWSSTRIAECFCEIRDAL